MNIINRAIEPVAKQLAGQYPVLTITGPRQSGKTTLCKKIFAHKPYANLESPDIRQFAIDDPRGFLAQFPNGAVLDEIQRAPDLISYIQPMVDENQSEGQFILTGSQQFEVSNSINQSLAGRTALIKLLPFSMEEIQSGFSLPSIDCLLYKGFYPRIWDKDLNPSQALGDYFETYIERDLRQLTSVNDLNLFQRFIKLCAGRIGQLLNMNSLANDAGVSHTTARNWLSILEASYIIFFLQPYHANISKRLVKSPKLYFYDVGLAAYLLNIQNETHIERDPLRGHLFENMVIAETLKYRFNHGKRNNLHFYRDSKGNEVDLLLLNGSKIFPVEIKAGMTITQDYFKGLNHFTTFFKDQVSQGAGLVYGGEDPQQRTGISIVPFYHLIELLNH
ncbi:MAG: ATP-binding protein [Proteobacteria bacterium]|nr:ATP-binding protein [Pseudomonadota bacterium]MBU1386740.1 ATP-binding protein [Pseudomonadota bacterium]MBU1544684.1 ATP-binding protein [Pseudomonadota bacterium]MBU2480541.1 ATP-binding protein [Pseudomonadota bacterium]